jgi:nucleoside-diphosphate-sugar epimerase
MKYLVTGGAGFIGSNLVEALLQRGHFVRVLDNFSTGKRENIKKFEKDVELIEGDIRSHHIVEQAVNGIDVVLHEAALPSVPRSIKDPITTNEVNVNGTLNILNAAVAAKTKRVVFASSSSIYGNNPELPKHEDMVPNPLSPYAVSKLAGENYCRVFAQIYGIETVALRYFNVFGPNQDPSSQYSAVIPKFINSVLKNESPVIYGDGEQSRDFTYISNVIEANILASEVKIDSPVIVNCACHDRITLNELVRAINKILGTNVQPVYNDTRTGDVKHSFAAIGKAEKMLNYRVTDPFINGLEKTVSYFQNLNKN